MRHASLFGVCVLVVGTTWYAITLQLAATSPAVGVAPRLSRATGIGLAATGTTSPCIGP